MLRNLVPSAFAMLRLASGHAIGIGKDTNQSLDCAALEDRILFNASPVGASVDGGTVEGEAASAEASGDWIIAEDYSGATTDVHDPLSGTWEIVDGEYAVTPASDAVSTLKLDDPLDENLELEVDFNADDGSAQHLSNAFVIFDYHSATDFKFAGAYVGVDQWVIGHRTASDWVTDTFVSAPINALTDYQLTLKVAGDSQVTLHADGTPVLTHTFEDAVTDGQIGLGTKNAVTRFDDLRLRFLPSDTAGTPGDLPLFEDFDDAMAENFSPAEGDWQLVDGHYELVSEIGETGASILLTSEEVPDDLEIGVTFDADPIVPLRFSNGVIIYDYHSETDFKYAGGFINRDEWVIGHKSGSEWIDDVVVAATLEPDIEYDMRVVIEDGNTVSLFTGDTFIASHTFGDSLTDGSVGLGSNNSVTRFDDFSVVDLNPAVSQIVAEWDGDDLLITGEAAGELLIQADQDDAFSIYDDGDLLYEFSGVEGNLLIELGDADDHVTLDMNGYTFWGSVFVDLADGDNYFGVLDGTIGKHLHFLSGSGEDEFVMADHAMIGMNVRVGLGDGANHFDASATDLGGHLTLNTGNGADDVSVAEDVTIGRNAWLSTDGGDDTVDFEGQTGLGLFVDTGDGDDSLALSDSAFAGSFAQMVDGDDRLDMLPGARLGHFVKVKSGAGDDTFSGPADGHCWIVSGGRGDDTIEWTGESHRHWGGSWWR